MTGKESVNKGSVFPICFTADDPPNSTIRFYYDSDTNPANGRTFIGSTTAGPTQETGFIEFGAFAVYLPLLWQAAPNEVDLYAVSDQFGWDTSNVPKNTFFLSADVDDGIMVTTWYSEIPVTIK